VGSKGCGKFRPLGDLEEKRLGQPLIRKRGQRDREPRIPITVFATKIARKKEVLRNIGGRRVHILIYLLEDKKSE